jgi:hypothetical protein
MFLPVTGLNIPSLFFSSDFRVFTIVRTPVLCLPVTLDYLSLTVFSLDCVYPKLTAHNSVPIYNFMK